MTLWSSPHPKESTALSLGQMQTSEAKVKELSDPRTTIPSSATSFTSDGSEDAGFEDGPIDVDMGDEETEGIQIDCIQTLTEFDPIPDADLGDKGGSPIMADYKTAIPLPAPPVNLGSAFGGNQAYSSIQNSLPRIMDRTSSPMQGVQPYWGATGNEARSTRSAGDVGLNNIGNTCFMNSGLQCLLHTSPLVEYFVESDSCQRSTASLVYQFHSLVKHAWFGYLDSIALHDFKLVLGNKYAQFKDCRQHDCQEFLAVLLDMLHEEMKSNQKAVTENMADSSMGESYVEDCTDQLQDLADQSVHSTSRTGSESSTAAQGRSSSQSNAEEASSSESGKPGAGSKAVKQVIKPKNGMYKKMKMADDTASRDSHEQNVDSHECGSSMKRKTVKSESGTNETVRNFDVENSENEAEVTGSMENLAQQNLTPVEQAQKSWDAYIEENNTVIASTFQGMFKSSVTCSECSYVSETYEPFMYLSLPIPRVMEKHLSVTFISMADRNPVKVELVLHLMGTVEKLIQEVVKKAGGGGGIHSSKYIAAEVVNYRIVRVLDDKIQLRNINTNTRNIYVYELNHNFDEKYGQSHTDHDCTFFGTTTVSTVSSSGGQIEHTTFVHEDWETEDSSCVQPSNDISSASDTYEHLRAPVGGGVYETSSAFGQGVSSSSDTHQNDNFNKVQCNICLEDFSKDDLKQHRGCSCVLCEECLLKSVEHFKTSSENECGKSNDGTYVKCAVCLQTVECKKAFVSLDESNSVASHLEFITIPLIFRNEPGTDANNNSAWSSGLFSYPWLLRVPSYINASELVDYIETINPVPGAPRRILSVKSDGKSCGQCVFSSRCGGCEIPKDGMISLNTCNSILISYTDLGSDRLSKMQPSDMAIHNELNPNNSSFRNEEPTIDIHDCLRTFSETEHLDEQNPWFCPRCRKNQRATKALSICKFPDYLIVYLKRFVFLDQSSNKLNNRLTFPINDLDVREYVTEGFGADLGKYDLYSCVCHYGNASAGHYTAFAKNPVTTQWHYFNDDTITERTPGDNEYSSAYVLFYQKQGMDCRIPTKCDGPLPTLNCFNKMSTSTSYSADIRGSYLPGEPVRVEGVVIGDMNLQVDSTSPSFAFPHSSSEAGLMGLEEDERVGGRSEADHIIDIREGLGLNYDVSSTSTGEDQLKDPLDHQELPSSSAGSADSTSDIQVL